jgi:hypothetical protein
VPQIVNRLNAFLKLASEHRVLALATSLASVALIYAAHFIISAPHEYADQARNQVRFDRYESEGERIDLVLQTLKETIKQSHESMSFYEEHFAGKKWPDPKDEEIVTRAFILNDTAKRHASAAVGLLTGIRLENEALEEYREQFRQSMEELNGIMTTFERFYLALGLRDEIKTKELLPELRSASTTPRSTVSRLYQGLWRQVSIGNPGANH